MLPEDPQWCCITISRITEHVYTKKKTKTKQKVLESTRYRGAGESRFTKSSVDYLNRPFAPSQTVMLENKEHRGRDEQRNLPFKMMKLFVFLVPVLALFSSMATVLYHGTDWLKGQFSLDEFLTPKFLTSPFQKITRKQWQVSCSLLMSRGALVTVASWRLNVKAARKTDKTVRLTWLPRFNRLQSIEWRNLLKKLNT